MRAQSYSAVKPNGQPRILTPGYTRQVVSSCGTLALKRRFGRLHTLYLTAIKGMPLIIYTKPGCPYCQKAREHYTGKGVRFEDRNAQDNLTFRREMLAITGGDPTVPAIVDDGRLIQQGWEGRG